jgi:two-component system, NtrC family, nitrogen regulation sensor histidine kinase NtrY
MILRKPPVRRLWLTLVVAVALLVTGRVLEYRQQSRLLNFQQLTERARDYLAAETKKAEANMQKLANAVKDSLPGRDHFAQIAASEEFDDYFYFFVYEQRKLVYWNSNRILPSIYEYISWNNGDVVFFSNGWFQVFTQHHGDITIAGLLLIKNEYAVKNNYLVNDFHPSLGLPQSTQLIPEHKPYTYPVNDASGKYLFALNFSSNDESGNESASAACYLGAVFFIVIFILNLLVLLARRRSNYGFLLLAALIGLRWWMIVFRAPEALYHLGLFSPEYYASTWFLNSLGDLLLNTLLFALCTVYIYIYIGGVVLVHQARVRHYTWSAIVIAILLIAFLFSVVINYLLSGLIINSQISFNINNVFELTMYSIIGIFIIGILLFCFYLVCDGSVRYIQKTHFDFGYVSILFLITQGIFLVLLIWLRDTEVFINYGVSAFLLANTLILFTTYIRRTSRRVFSFTRSLLVVLAFSVYAAQIVYEFNGTKEKERRMLIASRLENQHDLVAEYLFREVEQQLRADPFLDNFFRLPLEEHLVQPFLANDLQKRLLRLYFSGYLGKYDVQFKFFDRNDAPINNSGDPSWNLDAIQSIINLKGSSTFSPGFYYINNSNGRISYIALVNVRDSVKLGTLTVEINARLIQDRMGFPELLMNSEMGNSEVLQNYSHARYEEGRLVSQTGVYNYFLTPEPYADSAGLKTTPHFRTFNKYSHLFYPTSSGGLIIISHFNLGVLVYVTLFSYIFTFFSILYVIIYLFVRWANNNFHILESFKSRIQFSIVSIVIVALGMVGGATITYIINNYSQEQNNRIREKINDTVVLVENELIDRRGLQSRPSDEMIYAFNRLATILSLDFNIYDTNGALQFTSQPRFYDQELVAPQMNPEAFYQLTSRQKGIHIQNEHIATFNYISAYEPIRSSDNSIIAYINIPYYARQSELNREISSFLVALINIYVLLFSIAVFATFIISNRITQPLRIIQQSLKRTKLGSVNEQISWRRKDEIGSLVNEYNRMVEELHRSADKLARSERESAWREMAKQVAHEIKNPLTPMKLSVQHLQRSYRDGKQDAEMVDRIAVTLIEQIDTLSSIASAFSDFAKMPKANNTTVDLTGILDNVVHLYSENEHADLVYEMNNGDSMLVYGDKDQLIRIFSNLIKNAIQSIPDNRRGLVRIHVESFIDHYVVSVEDNGTGIPADLQEKIFVPNFTTKSTGTGLGLAMVKNLVEGMNGEVWFETREGKGTAFFVRIPAGSHQDAMKQ